jgi:hypothetical protein
MRDPVITWMAIWGAVVAAWIPAYWRLAMHEPAPHTAAVPQSGPVLAAVFLAVQPPASLLATAAAQVAWRRARARRERRLVARLRRDLAGP